MQSNLNFVSNGKTDDKFDPEPKNSSWEQNSSLHHRGGRQWIPATVFGELYRSSLVKAGLEDSWQEDSNGNGCTSQNVTVCPKIDRKGLAHPRPF